MLQRLIYPASDRQLSGARERWGARGSQNLHRSAPRNQIFNEYGHRSVCICSSRILRKHTAYDETLQRLAWPDSPFCIPLPISGPDVRERQKVDSHSVSNVKGKRATLGGNFKRQRRVQRQCVWKNASVCDLGWWFRGRRRQRRNYMQRHRGYVTPDCEQDDGYHHCVCGQRGDDGQAQIHRGHGCQHQAWINRGSRAHSEHVPKHVVHVSKRGRDVVEKRIKFSGITVAPCWRVQPGRPTDQGSHASLIRRFPVRTTCPNSASCSFKC